MAFAGTYSQANMDHHMFDDFNLGGGQRYNLASQASELGVARNNDFGKDTLSTLFMPSSLWHYVCPQ